MNCTIILFVCFCLGISGQRQNCEQKLDSLIVKHLHSFVAEFVSDWNNSPTTIKLNKEPIDSIRKQVQHLGEVKSPFEHTEFYKYYYTYGTMELTDYGYCGNGSMGVIYRNALDTSIIPDSTITQINSILSSERRFDDHDMVNLSRFLMHIISLKEYWIVGDTSEGIDIDDVDTLSILSKIYQSPVIKCLGYGLSINYYCALQDRGYLYEVTIIYNFELKSIKAISRYLGEYGKKRRRID